MASLSVPSCEVAPSAAAAAGVLAAAAAADVYISYSPGPAIPSDEGTAACEVFWGRRMAHSLAQALWEAGYSVHLDDSQSCSGSLRPAAPTANEVALHLSEQCVAVAAARAVVVCMSRAYAESPACRMEASFALAAKKQLLFVNAGIDVAEWAPSSFNHADEAEIRTHGWLSLLAGDKTWADFRSHAAAGGVRGLSMLLAQLSAAGIRPSSPPTSAPASAASGPTPLPLWRLCSCASCIVPLPLGDATAAGAAVAVSAAPERARLHQQLLSGGAGAASASFRGGRLLSASAEGAGDPGAASSGAPAFDVFVSYAWQPTTRAADGHWISHGQRDAHAIALGLRRAGFTVWLDTDHAASDAADPRAGMLVGISRSKAFVACVSLEYLRSDNCRLEARFASDAQRKRFVLSRCGSREALEELVSTGSAAAAAGPSSSVLAALIDGAAVVDRVIDSADGPGRTLQQLLSLLRAQGVTSSGIPEDVAADYVPPWGECSCAYCSPPVPTAAAAAAATAAVAAHSGGARAEAGAGAGSVASGGGCHPCRLGSSCPRSPCGLLHPRQLCAHGIDIFSASGNSCKYIAYRHLGSERPAVAPRGYDDCPDGLDCRLSGPQCPKWHPGQRRSAGEPASAAGSGPADSAAPAFRPAHGDSNSSAAALADEDEITLLKKLAALRLRAGTDNGSDAALSPTGGPSSRAEVLCSRIGGADAHPQDVLLACLQARRLQATGRLSEALPLYAAGATAVQRALASPALTERFAAEAQELPALFLQLLRPDPTEGLAPRHATSDAAEALRSAAAEGGAATLVAAAAGGAGGPPAPPSPGPADGTARFEPATAMGGMLTGARSGPDPPPGAAVTAGTLPLGMCLRGLKAVVELAGGPAVLADSSTEWLKQHVVLPATSGERCSMVTWVEKHVSPDFVSAATVFVSHSYRNSFAQLVETLQAWEARQPSGRYFYFVDLFSNNQHCAAPGEDIDFAVLRSVFGSSVRAIGRVVLVLDWPGKHPLTRLWCIYEILTAMFVGARFDVALQPADEAAFRARLLQDGAQVFRDLCNVNSDAAGAFKAHDRENIRRIVLSIDGEFGTVDRYVAAAMQDWLVQVGIGMLLQARHGASGRGHGTGPQAP